MSLERGARRKVELRLAEQLNRLRLVKSLASALCVGSWLAAALLYIGVLRPRVDRELASAQRGLTAEQRAVSEAEAKGARALRRGDDLAAQIESLQQELREARAATPAPPPPPGAGLKRPQSSRPPPSTASHTPCRDDGDPLNPCLKH